MAKEVKRMNYYNGLFLKEEDFITDQDYHIRMRQLMNWYLNEVYGVLDGLEVKPVAGSKKYKVTRGIALSHIKEPGEEYGVEIVLTDDTEVDLSGTSPGNVYITITYDDSVKVDKEEEKGDKEIHIAERPKVELKSSPDREKNIVLARVTVPSGDWTSDTAPITTSERIDIGPAIRTINGKVGIGTTAPGEKLEIAGNLRIAGLDSYLDFGSDPRQMINLWGKAPNATFGIGVQPNTQYYRSAGNFAWYIGGTHNDKDLEPGGGTAAMIIKGGNVGIGSMSPTGHQLDVASSQGAAGNSAIRALYPGGGGLLNTEFAALAHRGGAWTGLYAKQGAASSAAYFDGSVGIGTSSPLGRLNIVGSDGVGKGIQIDNREIKLRGEGDAHYSIFANRIPGKLTIEDTSSSGDMNTAGIVAMAIAKTSGNIGIGTAAPSEKLEVNGTVKAIAFVGDGSKLTGISTGAASQWSDGAGGVIYYNKGNIGIGASTPENADGWNKVLDILGSVHAKLSVRTAGIDARVLAHDVGWWNAPAGMIIGTKTAHPLSFGTNSASRVTIDKDGDLGIGTTNPFTKLHIVSAIGAEAAGYGNPWCWGQHIEHAATQMWGLKDSYGSLFTWDSDSLFVGLKNEGANRKDPVIAWGDDVTESLRFMFTLTGETPPAPLEVMRLTASGNVGIGTTAPTHRFHVLAPDAVGLFESTGTQAYLRLSTSEGLNNRVEITNRPGGRLSLWTAAGGDVFNITRDGNVGIGTTTPQDKLDVAGTLRILTGSNPIRFTAGWSGFPDPVTNQAEISNDTGTYKTLMIVGNKSGGLGRRVSVWDRLEVNGTFKCTGYVAGGETATGWVLGGGGATDNWLRLTATAGGYHDLAVNHFWSAGAQRFDLAEVTPVKAEDELEQGDVVVIDKEDGLRVTRSKKPSETSVYGIVSSYATASMIIGGGGPESVVNASDKLPIALIGRVKAKASAEAGEIQVGDLLTTSSTPGHLMKCNNISKCAGAIVGKALEALENGTGMITVLVTLQ